MTRCEKSVNTFRQEKTYDLTFRQHVRYFIDTAWMAYLTPTETKVVNFLCSRTLYWGKVWEVVTAKHFTVGCEGHFAGTGLTKKTVLACLDRLVSDNFVRRRKAGNTWAYSVNVLDMGTKADPVRCRVDAHRVRLETVREFRIGKARAMRDLTRQYEATGDRQYLLMACELGAEKSTTGGCKVYTLRDDITPSLSATETHQTSFDVSERFAHATTLGGEPVLPKKRNKKPTTEECIDEAKGILPATPAKRRKVLRKVEHNPAAERAVTAARQAALPPRTRSRKKPQPAPATTTGDYIQETLETNKAKRAARLRKKPVTWRKMQAAWHDAVATTYKGGELLNWGPANIGRANSILTIHHTLPEPGMTWIDVIEWYVQHYGFALQLSIPFMVKTEEQRADLLGNRPKLSLFLHFAQEIMEAYHRQQYGVGFPQVTYDRADEAQAEHERWVERREISATLGSDAIPVDMRTDAEVLDAVRSEATATPEGQQVIREIDAFDEIASHMRDTGSTETQTRAEVARADNLMSRTKNRDQYEDALQAVRDDQRAMVRDTYGEDLTDEECDDLLREMYEDQD